MEGPAASRFWIPRLAVESFVSGVYFSFKDECSERARAVHVSSPSLAIFGGKGAGVPRRVAARCFPSARLGAAGRAAGRAARGARPIGRAPCAHERVLPCHPVCIRGDFSFFRSSSELSDAVRLCYTRRNSSLEAI